MALSSIRFSIGRFLRRCSSTSANLDEYGTTIFNRLQLGAVLPELLRLREFVSTDGEKKVVEEVISLATEIEARVHTFLVFLGD